MYTTNANANANAGIRPIYAPYTNRHMTSSSDPPGSTSTPSTPSFYHQPRLSDGYVFPAPTRSIVRTTVYAPPSSYHSSYHSSASSSFLLGHSQPQKHNPSSSGSSHQHNYRPSGSISSLASRPSLSIDALNNPQPSSTSSTQNLISNPPKQQLSGSSGSEPASINPTSMPTSTSTSMSTPTSNPNSLLSKRLAPTSSNAINVKRLMSKPTAIPPRVHSVLSFSGTRARISNSISMSDTEDSLLGGRGSGKDDNEEDQRAIKSHSLDILRRCKRRSRSVDMVSSTHTTSSGTARVASPESTPSSRHGRGQPHLTLYASSPTSPTNFQETTSVPPSSYVGRTSYPGVIQSPTSSGTITQVRPGNQLPNQYQQAEDSDRIQHARRTSRRPNSAGHPSSSYDTPRLSSSFTTGTSPAAECFSPIPLVTPASAIALAWNEAQKRAAALAATAEQNATAAGPALTSIASPFSSSTSLATIRTGSTPTNTLHPKQPSRSHSLPVASPPLPPNANTIEVQTNLTSNSATDVAPPSAFNLNSPQSRRMTGTGTAKNSNSSGNVNGGADVMESEDPFLSWVLAEKALAHAAGQASSDGPSSSGGGSGGVVVGPMGATIRELSRRLTGAIIGRKERSREIFYHGSEYASFPPPVATLTAEPTEAAPVNSTPGKEPSGLISPRVSKERLFAANVGVDAGGAAAGHEGATNLVNRHIISSHTPVGAVTAHELIPAPLPSAPSSSPSGTAVHEMPYRPSLSINSKESRQELSYHQPIASPSSFDTSKSHSHSHSHWEHVPIPAHFPQAPSQRAHTPNTLKKRSRGSLRKKSSSSAFVPAIGNEDVTAHVFTSPSTPTTTTLQEEDNPSSLPPAGKLRGLVRKLSSGALKRPSSTSEKSRSSHHRKSPSSYTGSNHGHEGFGGIPPVPPLPKDFELITDPDAYFAERARRREERIDSDNDSAAHSSGLSRHHMLGLGSQKSSRRSSLARTTDYGHSEPALSTVSHTYTSVEAFPKQLKRAGTEPIPYDHLQLHSQSFSGQATRYVFPKRPRPKQELSSSFGSTSYSVSGTDHHRSLPPSPSSPDLRTLPFLSTSNNRLRGNDSKISLESHEMGSSQAHSLIAQPSMPAKDLYRHGEEEVGVLRSRQQVQQQAKEPGPTRKASAGLQTSHDAERSPFSPPPKISPTLIVPLGVPPPRPPRRREVKSKASTMSIPVSADQPSPSAPHSRPLRPTHVRHQRSLSSPPPLSPDLPTFSNTSVVNATPLSKRSRSFGGQPRELVSSVLISSRSPASSVPVDILSPEIRRTKSSTSLKNKKGMNLPPLSLTTKSAVSSAQSSPSPLEDGHNERKLRVKTSIGALGRMKSLMSAKSTTTPSTSGISSSPFSPPSSSGASATRRSTSRSRSSREKEKRDDGDMPPMPLTSTAVGFKDLRDAVSLSPSTAGNTPSKSPRNGGRRTEIEREDMWRALLEKSERAGGTLTVNLESDNLISEHVKLDDD